MDDAIVVGEHADQQARRLAVVAAETAACRMALLIFAATTNDYCWLVVVGGRFGDLIADIPFTVAVVSRPFL